jgi:hypothetical protein
VKNIDAKAAGNVCKAGRAGCLVPHGNQVSWLRIRQRLEQNAVDDAEDRRIGAHA